MVNHKLNNRYYKTTGVVLKHSPLGEADRLLTVYTTNMGKLKLVGKGVRRTKSKLGGHLDLLSHCQLEVSKGRDLDNINSASSINSFQLLRENLTKTAAAFYCLDLVDSLTPENEPDYNIFLALVSTLEKMLNTENPLIIWHFSFKILYLTGYLPELYNCGNCQKKIQPNKHAFNPILGGVVCDNCSTKLENNLQVNKDSFGISINTIKILRYFGTHTLENIINLNVETSILTEIQKALLAQITVAVEKNLKSTLFLNHISKFISNIE
jgi:DNA repair protein RecO (recombination protein O)